MSGLKDRLKSIRINKKTVAIILGGAAFLAAAGIVYSSTQSGPDSQQVLSNYLDYWEQKDYQSMYSLLSREAKENVDKKTFVQQHRDIAKEIELKEIQLKMKPVEEKNAETLPFSVKMDSGLVGDFSLNNKARMVEDEEGWRVQWTPSMIFPGMKSGDQVKADRIMTGHRGEITARDGKPLAVNKEKTVVGMIPQQVKDPRQTGEKLAEELDLKPETVQKKVKQGKEKKPDQWITLQTLSEKDKKRIPSLLKIPGVTVKDASTRVYPEKDLTAHLTGYIRPIKKEQLKKRKDQGYQSGDWVGQSGLEEELEKQLRIKPGYRILITDAKGRQKDVIATTPSKDGKDFQLTIDLKTQKQLYRGIKKDKGAGVALDPETGEVLGMVSAPSYDPNNFINGLTQKEWKRISGSSQPLVNRAKIPYSPGSTMKPLTAAIGLDTGEITPKTTYNTDEGKWQKDSSWGGYYVRRVDNPGGGVDLGEALAWSDNIYFARAGLKIGGETMIKYLKKFGFDDQMDFVMDVKPSQYSNDQKFSNEIQLADTSYGQGQLLISPLHLAATYTTFTNDGNMLKPRLIKEKKKEPEVWKKHVVEPKVAKKVYDLLTGVVNKPKGSARDLKTSGVRLGAKTGTAELKASRDSKDQRQLGWLAWIAGPKKENPDIVVAAMVDEVQDRGGSHYIFPAVKKMLEERYQ
ncbi:penicillin-binding transpeptidase domain-containing protein [Paludifilum halophilum]|uniref:Penicillin-binding protein n=1 Tax=Paludifilum halophilum TaxID=1642702 RepID=A0A235B7M7_9BACL|nr:penicillin-binding transpeptidase domain-containing protein [Paludifilum halophilum]OYD08318.1 hypothetical protein CHM34_05580 [Paludifilum halophilum]